ncbi:universal stress protein [Pseudonocardia acidicola]|uniref:Universal stress protein n=1 Tax=Pseudonocardia acidicola TaxID=2724939 RepID=A0ABX1SCM1_9PSEU|nr:universal stress protein [Pseudonocardia acidicola]
MNEQHGGHDSSGVVVGVDGTDIALRAVSWATAEAHSRGLPLRIVHAAPYAAEPAGPGRRRAATILARAYTVAHRREPDVPVRTERTDDPAVRALLDESGRARLLVLGMGGGQRLEEALAGSTALAVSGHADCPVVVVRGHHRSRASRRPVLIGLDDPHSEAAVLTVAFDDARRRGTGLTVLHARHGAGPLRDHLLGHDEEAHAEAVRRLNAALRPWRARYPDVPVELRVIRGQPTDHLLEAAAGARLLVVGTRGRGAPVRALFGSTSREVMRRSPCPVEVVRPGITITEDGDRPMAAAEHRTLTPGGPPQWLEHPHDLGELW